MLRLRSAGWLRSAGLASTLTDALFTCVVFPDRTVFFSHNNQSEQYFSLFFSPAEQPADGIMDLLILKPKVVLITAPPYGR